MGFLQLGTRSRSVVDDSLGRGPKRRPRPKGRLRSASQSLDLISISNANTRCTSPADIRSPSPPPRLFSSFESLPMEILQSIFIFSQNLLLPHTCKTLHSNLKNDYAIRLIGQSVWKHGSDDEVAIFFKHLYVSTLVKATFIVSLLDSLDPHGRPLIPDLASTQSTTNLCQQAFPYSILHPRYSSQKIILACLTHIFFSKVAMFQDIRYEDVYITDHMVTVLAHAARHRCTIIFNLFSRYLPKSRSADVYLAITQSPHEESSYSSNITQNDSSSKTLMFDDNDDDDNGGARSVSSTQREQLVINGIEPEYVDRLLDSRPTGSKALQLYLKLYKEGHRVTDCQGYEDEIWKQAFEHGGDLLKEMLQLETPPASVLGMLTKSQA